MTKKVLFLAVCAFSSILMAVPLNLKEGKSSGSVTIEGNTAIMRKNAQILYPDFKVGTDNGKISFDIRFDFDTGEVSANYKDNPLTGQSLITIRRQDGLYLNIYFIFDTAPRMCVAVFGEGHKIYQYTDHRFNFKKDEFYHVEVSYGNAIKTLINGNPSTKPSDQEHLFGNVEDVQMDLIIGNADKESRYTVKNIDIQSNDSTPERISIPTVSGSIPDIDGEITEDFWKRCAPITGFINGFTTKDVATEQPVMYIGMTGNGIYIAGIIPAMAGTMPRASCSKRDGQIYLDDAVEFRFQRQKGDKFRIFMINCNGFIYDSLETPGKHSADSTLYDPEWKQAVASKGNIWQFEAFLPFAAIGGKPAPGDIWKGNFCVDRAGNLGNGISLFQAQNYNDESTFGEFYFTGKSQAVGIEKFTSGAAMQPVVTIFKPGDRQPVVYTRERLFNPQGTKIDTFEFRFADTDTALYQAPEVAPGVYRLELCAYDADDNNLLRRVVSCRVAPRVVTEVTHYAYWETAMAKMRVAEGAVKGAKMARVSLLDESGRSLGFHQETRLKETMRFPFSTKSRSPGKYTILFELKDADGKVLDTTRRSLEIFPKPAWFDNQIGIDHTVPYPWTPVTGDRQRLSVWNRTFHFNGKTQLFASAPQLSLKLAGSQTIQLHDMVIESEDVFDDQITFHAKKNVAGYTVNLDYKVEFDGCARCDITITPPAKGGTINSFFLDFPLKKEWGKFLMSGDGSGMAALPITAKMEKPFSPYNWVGNERGGMAIFYESEQYWTPSNSKAITILPRGDSTIWHYEVINSPISLTEPITLTFGMMPTPVRPANTNNPFANAKHGAGPAMYSYGETLMYRVPEAARKSGCIEFMMKREYSLGYPATEFFQFLPAQNISPLSFFANRNGQISFIRGNKVLATGTVEGGQDVFRNVAVAWNNGTITLLYDGRKILEYELDEKEVPIFTNAMENGHLVIGGCQAWRSNSSDMLIDEVRISKSMRAETVPTAPRKADADTLLIDHLDESFVPDGFSMLTAAGGEASSGSRFIEGAFGKGLSLYSEKPMSDAKRRKEIFKAEIELIWKWHTDGHSPTGEYLWPPDYFHPLNPRVDKIAKEAHANNYKFIAYCIYPAIHYPSPLADQFRAEWQVEPVNMLPYAPPAGHNMLTTSMAAKGWADYLIAGLEDAFKMYGFNGIYTDGGVAVHASTNAFHGAGWTDAKGNRRPSWPFFAARDNFKRIYKFVKKDNKDNVVVNHISFTLPMMTTSFSDLIYTGEHENYYDMNTARLRFNSAPWGPQVVLLGASDHMFSALHQMTGLLVGTSNWPHSITGRRDNARKQLRIQQAYEAFDTVNAEFIPFYDMEEKLDITLPDKIYACCYRQGEKWLMLVANYTKEVKQVEIKLPSTVKAAHSALTQAPIPHSSSVITPSVLPENFQLIEIKF
jgi:hypothetical protein